MTPNPPIPTLDFETYSAAGFEWQQPTEKYPLGRWIAPLGADKPGLGAVGSANYARHPSTEVLTCSYDLCDGRGIRRWQPGKPLPIDLFAHIVAGGVLESHNAMFEFLIWNEVCVRLYGWPLLPAAAQRCSMATAHVAQYPGALANLGTVLGLTEKKDKRGGDLIKRFCVPQQPVPGLVDKKTGKVKREPVTRTRIYPHDDPAGFEELCAYCDQDVRTEMEAASRMPPMEPEELAFWQLDQRMNARGIGLDRDGLRACIVILQQVLDQYGAECRTLTGFNVTQLEKLKGWLAAYGVHTDSLDAAALDRLLADADAMHPSARRVLELRSLTGSASVKKTFAMDNECCDDSRLRNLVIHHGARTGRPTGASVQPLNLPKAGPKLAWCECGRPHKPQPLCPWCGAVTTAGARTSWQVEMVDHVLEVMALGSLAMVEQFFGDAMLCISGCVRPLFVAEPGSELVASDYTAIEAVVAACLAGEQWRIDAFTNGDPIYLVGASKITGTSLDTYLAYHAEHGEHHIDRQRVGKVSELACISPETSVLTDSGYVRMSDVTTAHLLWDGETWVNHWGLISRGKRRVIDVDGVKMTPDHEINCGGFWTVAEELVSNERLFRQALRNGSANLPSNVLRIKKRAVLTAFLYTVRVVWDRTKQTCIIWFMAKLRDVAFALCESLWKHVNVTKENRGRTIGRMLTFCRTMTTVGDCLIGFQPALRVASPVARSTRTATTPAAAFECTSRGDKAQTGGGLFFRTLSRLKAGTSRIWNSTVSALMAITSRAIYGSSAKPQTFERGDVSTNCKPSSISTSLVYDIVNAGPRNRFTIKTDSGHLIVHNCGYGGWIGSYKAFGSTEPDATIRQQILAWRDASPAIVECWGGQWRGPPWRRGRAELFGYEGMFIAAVQNPGVTYTYRGIRFCMEEPDCLVVRLLSGRPLRYREPHLRTSSRNADELSISYMTWNSNPKYGATGWVRMDTYGGRIFENICQAVACDVMRYAMVNAELLGFDPVLAVYDELVVEVAPGTCSVEQLEAVMGTLPPWAAGWPIRAAGGWTGRRYRKG